MKLFPMGQHTHSTTTTTTPPPLLFTQPNIQVSFNWNKILSNSLSFLCSNITLVPYSWQWITALIKQFYLFDWLIDWYLKHVFDALKTPIFFPGIYFICTSNQLKAIYVSGRLMAYWLEFRVWCLVCGCMFTVACQCWFLLYFTTGKLIKECIFMIYDYFRSIEIDRQIFYEVS